MESGIVEVKWWESHDNRIELAHWLYDAGWFNNPFDVIRFFEKPWKWEPEWNEMREEDSKMKNAGFVVSTRQQLVRWCKEHEAQDAGSFDRPLGYCWHSYYLEQATLLGDPCRMVDGVLLTREIEVADE